MILAQALGEYAAMAAVAEAATALGYQIEALFGEWGMEAILVLVIAAIVWKFLFPKR